MPKPNEQKKSNADYGLGEMDSISQLLSPAVSYRITPPADSSSLIDRTEELNKEITVLRKDIRNLVSELEMKNKESTEYRKTKKVQESMIENLKNKVIFSYILSSVREDVQRKIYDSTDFRTLFENTSFCESFVLSIDIRRSTELMLKAREPERFAEFISCLCRGLSQIILGNFGVFDKFTGDGILAFFPDFCSGPDAGLLAIDSALKCHAFFAEYYKASRHWFTSVLENTGLGIGIDFGTTYLVKIQGALTLVGRPVVYACRMSGGKAGDTLLNHIGFDHVASRYTRHFNFEKITLNIKHEGEAIAYRVRRNGSPLNPVHPDWNELVKQFVGRTQNDKKRRITERRYGKRLRASGARRQFKDANFAGHEQRINGDRRLGKDRRKLV